MADWSVRNPNTGPQRNADALLRAVGGYSPELLISPAQGDATDAGQLGLDMPNLQSLLVAPAVFRKVRPLMQEGDQARYELLVSASAIDEQVSLLNLESVEALLQMVVALSVAGLRLVLEGWAFSASLGEPIVYRLLLRTAASASASRQS